MSLSPFVVLGEVDRIRSSMYHASVYEGKSHTNPSYFTSVKQTVVASVNVATPS
jgi:hypothetical protein